MLQLFIFLLLCIPHHKLYGGNLHGKQSCKHSQEKKHLLTNTSRSSESTQATNLLVTDTIITTQLQSYATINISNPEDENVQFTIENQSQIDNPTNKAIIKTWMHSYNRLKKQAAQKDTQAQRITIIIEAEYKPSFNQATTTNAKNNISTK